MSGDSKVVAAAVEKFGVTYGAFETWKNGEYAAGAALAQQVIDGAAGDALIDGTVEATLTPAEQAALKSELLVRWTTEAVADKLSKDAAGIDASQQDPRQLHSEKESVRLQHDAELRDFFAAHPNIAHKVGMQDAYSVSSTMTDIVESVAVDAIFNQIKAAGADGAVVEAIAQEWFAGKNIRGRGIRSEQATDEPKFKQYALKELGDLLEGVDAAQAKQGPENPEAVKQFIQAAERTQGVREMARDVANRLTQVGVRKGLALGATTVFGAGLVAATGGMGAALIVAGSAGAGMGGWRGGKMGLQRETEAQNRAKMQNIRSNGDEGPKYTASERHRKMAAMSPEEQKRAELLGKIRATAIGAGIGAGIGVVAGAGIGAAGSELAHSLGFGGRGLPSEPRSPYGTVQQPEIRTVADVQPIQAHTTAVIDQVPSGQSTAIPEGAPTTLTTAELHMPTGHAPERFLGIPDQSKLNLGKVTFSEGSSQQSLFTEVVKHGNDLRVGQRGNADAIAVQINVHGKPEVFALTAHHGKDINGNPISYVDVPLKGQDAQLALANGGTVHGNTLAENMLNGKHFKSFLKDLPPGTIDKNGDGAVELGGPGGEKVLNVAAIGAVDLSHGSHGTTNVKWLSSFRGSGKLAVTGSQSSGPGPEAPPPAASTEVNIGGVEVSGVPGLHETKGALYEGHTLLLGKDGVDALSKSLKSHFIFVDKSGRTVEPDIIYHKDGTITVVDAKHHDEVLVRNAHFGKSANGDTQLITQERGITLEPRSGGVTTITFNEEGPLVTKPIDLTAITGQIEQYLQAKGTTRLGPIEVPGLEVVNGQYEIAGITVPKADMDALKGALNHFTFEKYVGSKLGPMTQPPVLEIIPGHGLALVDQTNGTILVDHIGLTQEAGHPEFTYTPEQADIVQQNGQIVIRETANPIAHAQAIEHRLPLDFENQQAVVPPPGGNGTHGAETAAQIGQVEIQGLKPGPHGTLVEIATGKQVLNASEYERVSGFLNHVHFFDNEHGGHTAITPEFKIDPQGGIMAVDPNNHDKVLFEGLQVGLKPVSPGTNHWEIGWRALPTSSNLDFDVVNGKPQWSYNINVNEARTLSHNPEPLDLTKMFSDFVQESEHGKPVPLGHLKLEGLQTIVDGGEIKGYGLDGHVFISKDRADRLAELTEHHLHFKDSQGEYDATLRFNDGKFQVLDREGKPLFDAAVSNEKGHWIISWDTQRGMRLGADWRHHTYTFESDLKSDTTLQANHIDLTELNEQIEHPTSSARIGNMNIYGLEELKDPKTNQPDGLGIAGYQEMSEARLRRVSEIMGNHVKFERIVHDASGTHTVKFVADVKPNPDGNGFVVYDGNHKLFDLGFSDKNGELDIHVAAAKGVTSIDHPDKTVTFTVDEGAQMEAHDIQIPISDFLNLTKIAEGGGGPHGPTTSVTELVVANTHNPHVTTFALGSGKIEAHTGNLVGTNGTISSQELISYEKNLSQIQIPNGAKWLYDGGNGFILVNEQGTQLADFEIHGNVIDVVGIGGSNGGIEETAHGIVYNENGTNTIHSIELKKFGSPQEQLIQVSQNEITANIDGHEITLKGVKIENGAVVTADGKHTVINPKDLQALLTGSNLEKIMKDLSTAGIHNANITYVGGEEWHVETPIGQVPVWFTHEHGHPLFTLTKPKSGGNNGGQGGQGGSPAPTSSNSSTGSPSPSPSGSQSASPSRSPTPTHSGSTASPSSSPSPTPSPESPTATPTGSRSSPAISPSASPQTSSPSATQTGGTSVPSFSAAPELETFDTTQHLVDTFKISGLRLQANGSLFDPITHHVIYTPQEAKDYGRALSGIGFYTNSGKLTDLRLSYTNGTLNLVNPKDGTLVLGGLHLQNGILQFDTSEGEYNPGSYDFIINGIKNSQGGNIDVTPFLKGPVESVVEVGTNDINVTTVANQQLNFTGVSLDKLGQLYSVSNNQELYANPDTVIASIAQEFPANIKGVDLRLVSGGNRASAWDVVYHGQHTPLVVDSQGKITVNENTGHFVVNGTQLKFVANGESLESQILKGTIGAGTLGGLTGVGVGLATMPAGTSKEQWKHVGKSTLAGLGISVAAAPLIAAWAGPAAAIFMGGLGAPGVTFADSELRRRAQPFLQPEGPENTHTQRINAAEEYLGGRGIETKGNDDDFTILLATGMHNRAIVSRGFQDYHQSPELKLGIA